MGLGRQARKSVKQLQAEISHKTSGKVGDLGLNTALQKVDLSYIPGREVVKENQRAIARRKQMEEEAQKRREEASRDWTETDEFGNLIVSVKNQEYPSAHDLVKCDENRGRCPIGEGK